MKQVPIDYRACLDVDGDATDVYLDVGAMLVGISVLVGSSWAAEQRVARGRLCYGRDLGIPSWSSRWSILRWSRHHIVG